MSLRLSRLALVANAILLAGFAAAVPAKSATVNWADWTSFAPGDPGSANGSIALGPAIGISYAGQTNGGLINYPSWTPVSTFSGGSVDNAPPASGNAIQMVGGSNTVNTITFSSPVVDPVMAIWSLGAGGAPASFVFTSAEPFTVEAGGPSAEYAGSGLTVSGNSVYGAEGNGVIQFNGTFSTLTWTTPVYENYYAFTIGADAAASGAPEPAAVGFLVLGLAGLMFYSNRRRGTARS